LGCFRVDPRAESLYQKKQSVPLRKEDGGSKVKKKSSFFRVPSSCSSLCFSLHRGLLPQPPEPPPAATVLPVVDNSTCTVRNGRRSKNRDREGGRSAEKKNRKRETGVSHPTSRRPTKKFSIMEKE